MRQTGSRRPAQPPELHRCRPHRSVRSPSSPAANACWALSLATTAPSSRTSGCGGGLPADRQRASGSRRCRELRCERTSPATCTRSIGSRSIPSGHLSTASLDGAANCQGRPDRLIRRHCQRDRRAHGDPRRRRRQRRESDRYRGAVSPDHRLRRIARRIWRRPRAQALAARARGGVAEDVDATGLIKEAPRPYGLVSRLQRGTSAAGGT